MLLGMAVSKLVNYYYMEGPEFWKKVLKLLGKSASGLVPISIIKEDNNYKKLCNSGVRYQHCRNHI